jgi:hypothetical protein
MKKIILAALITTISLSSFAKDPGVNEKVLDAFNKTFQNVQEVTWSELPQSYEVQFKQNEIKSSITYDMNGNILKTLRYYHEDHLPLIVLTKVKNKYADKKIFGITELSTEEETTYYITLEDDKMWYNIKSDSHGFTTLEKKYKKA